MKVLITGIEGFVGQYLAQHLSSLNYQVAGIYYIQPQNQSGDIYQCDIRNYAHLRQIIKINSPQVIFHLAAQSSVAQGEKNLKDTFACNTQGTLNLLEAVRETGINARIIYISSCEVYGLTSNSESVLTEQSPTNPISFYALSKLCAEKICLYHVQYYNLDIVILRPFSHTGPGQSENFIFPKIAKKIAEIEAGLTESNITVGNIDVQRDYTDISDMVKAYQLASEKCKGGEIYNVTSGKYYSIRKGIEFLLNQSSKKIELKIDESLVRNNDIPLLHGSAEKFTRETGWQPEIDFYTTLTNLLNHYRIYSREQ